MKNWAPFYIKLGSFLMQNGINFSIRIFNLLHTCMQYHHNTLYMNTLTLTHSYLKKNTPTTCLLI